MPGAIVQRAENIVITSGTNTITFGSAVTAGNVVVLFILQNTALTRTFVSTGFTEQVAQDATVVRSMKLRYIVESGTPTTYTVTVAGGLTATYSVVGYELSGMDTGSLFVAAAGQQEAASTSHTINAAGQNIGDDDVWLGAAMVDSANASWGALTFATVTQDYTAVVGSASRVNASYVPGSAVSGFTGPFTVGTSRSTFSIGAVLRGAVAAGGVAGHVVGSSFGGRIQGMGA